MTFKNNLGYEGAALSVTWKGHNLCLNNITGAVFTGNNATSRGGAIYYDVYQPILGNITYVNNSAPYGTNIGSYPVRVLKIESLSSDSSSFKIIPNFSIDDVASGQIYPNELKMALVDNDGQIVADQTSGIITIVSVSSGASVLGQTSAPIVNGIASFKEIIFKAKPGSKDVLFSAFTLSIDKSIIFEAFNVVSVQEPFKVSFRYCMPGEADENFQCNKWTSGSYSVNWNDTTWTECMNNANCLGGTEIHIDKGFWRSAMNSTSLIECIRKKSWEGGYFPNNKYPVKCQTGYEGILCTDWVVASGKKYERLANYECSKCPDPIMNALRIAGLVALVGSYFIVMIVIGIRKKRESQQSILLRILTNYLQLLTTALSFNLKFPTTLTQIFYPVERIGSSSEAFLSFDWFITDTEIKAFTPSVAIFKIFLTGLLPFALIIGAVLIWLVVFAIMKNKINLKRNIVISIIVIVFLIHPTVTKVGFEIFQCIQVDQNEFKVKVDLEIAWFSKKHLLWWFALGVPIVGFWTIGAPTAAFIILFRNRNKLDDPQIQSYFLMLYQGLKPKTYYWEIVNTIRKVLMVAINVFMSTIPLTYTAFTAVISLLFLIRLQIRLSPYKERLNNELEIEAMIAGTATLFWGVLFIQEESSIPMVTLLVLILLIIINMKFFLFWILLFLSIFADEHELLLSVYNLLAMFLCKRKFARELIEKKKKRKLLKEDGKHYDAEGSLVKVNIFLYSPICTILISLNYFWISYWIISELKFRYK